MVWMKLVKPEKLPIFGTPDCVDGVSWAKPGPRNPKLSPQTENLRSEEYPFCNKSGVRLSGATPACLDHPALWTPPFKREIEQMSYETIDGQMYPWGKKIKTACNLLLAAKIKSQHKLGPGSVGRCVIGNTLFRQ